MTGMAAARGFARTALALPDSATHGTRGRIEELNRVLGEAEKIIDLSIGALDAPTDRRIDDGVCDFIRNRSTFLHAFAPVKGYPFLLQSIAARVRRLHGIAYDPETEIMVTPGGIKGAITVLFHALLDPGDEVVIPLPNWPHYGDMVRLHGAVPKFVPLPELPSAGLGPSGLEGALTGVTKLVILGDCINPTGKVYSTVELRELAQVIARHNVRREAEGGSPIHVLFDCPYEAHIFGPRAETFAALSARLEDGRDYSMRRCTAMVTGPGKTYGMHGDRIGYMCAAPDILEIASRVQVNLNSFASSYGQVATHLALQEEMDEIATRRAAEARANMHEMLGMLNGIPDLEVDEPDGGYFLFVDFSRHAPFYQERGFDGADRFLLEEARVAAISGSHFADGMAEFDHYARLNCGRSPDLLRAACERIEQALARLSSRETTAALRQKEISPGLGAA